MHLTSKSWRQTMISVSSLLLSFIFACKPDVHTAVLVKPGFANNHVSQAWLDALQTRQRTSYLDSLARVTRPLTETENDWLMLLQSKTSRWNSFRDPLSTPFEHVILSDSIHVLAGYLGSDDGFTWQHQIICLDLTALAHNYGTAKSPENGDRIDRIFSHEYTHLLHKAWARKNNLILKNFRDSVLWECLYEGIGMYRSLSKKWALQNDSLPAVTRDALETLYPVFVDRLVRIHQIKKPTAEEKIALSKNLSRGNVGEKWGAFPVAIWLMRESKGNDKNLIRWINAGPESVPELANKYLPEEQRKKLQAIF